MADQSTAVPTTPAPGIINVAPAQTSAVPSASNPTITSGPVAGYNPAQAPVTPYRIDPSTMTTAGQLQGIIASGSPLMQQAQANAREQMNARGLLNSSQAITAGQLGVINAALPIAQSDAQAYQQAMTNTATARNQQGQFNTGQTNAALAQGATQANAITQARMGNEAALTQQTMQNAGNLANIQAQGSINVQLTKMQDQNKLVLQTSAGAAQYYSQALQYMSNIATSPNLSTEQKTNALNNAVMQLNDALGVMTTIAGLPGVQSLLNFTNGS